MHWLLYIVVSILLAFSSDIHAVIDKMLCSYFELLNLAYFLRGRGLFSFSMSRGSVHFFPRQLPLTLSRQTELITRSFWVFLQNSVTVGFSFTQPLWRWQPKNFSRGSWLILSLKKTSTPGMVKIKRTSSTKLQLCGTIINWTSQAKWCLYWLRLMMISYFWWMFRSRRFVCWNGRLFCNRHSRWWNWGTWRQGKPWQF